MAEQVLDDMKRMLNFRTKAGLQVLQLFCQATQFFLCGLLQEEGHAIDLGQEAVAPRQLLLGGVFKVVEALLHCR